MKAPRNFFKPQMNADEMQILKNSLSPNPRFIRVHLRLFIFQKIERCNRMIL